MKSMKRYFAAILVLALALALFAGCGGNGTPAATEAPTATEAPAATEAAAATPAEPAEPDLTVALPLVEETIDMEYWTYFLPFLLMYNLDFANVTFFKEMEARTNVHMNITAFPIFLAFEQFGVMYASGAYPDLIEGGAQFYPQGPDDAIENGIFVPFNDFIEEWMPNYWAALNADPVFLHGACSVEGQYYAAHTLQVIPEGSPNGPVIRQDWLDELGLERPVTYDQYHDVLTQFKAAGLCDGPMWITANAFQRGSYLAAGYGVKTFEVAAEVEPWVVADGEVQFSAISDGMLEYVTMLNQWWNEGLIYADYMSGNPDMLFPQDSSIITTNKVGIVYVNVDDIAAYAGQAEDPDFRLTAIYDARKNEGDVLQLRNNSIYVDEGVVISTSCENIEVAAKWLDYCYSDEGYLLTNYGVEGEGLAYDANGKPCFSDLVLHNETYTPIAACSVYAKYGGAMLLDGQRQRPGFNEDQMEAMEIWDSDEEGMIFPPRAMKTAGEGVQYNDIMSDIEVYVSESANKFITGQMPLSDWNTYVQTVKDAGIDEAQAIMQTVYDRYMEKMGA